MYINSLKERIQNKKIIVGVIGLGYVGLPLAMEFAKTGIKTFGFDIAVHKVNNLNQGKSHIMDVSDNELSRNVANGLFHATANFELLSTVDAISICVPTPLTKSQEPDMSYILAAVEQIRHFLKKGALITLESTTYPGTTEELIERTLSKDGFIVGEDYFLCYSPERVDPGNLTFNTENTPKVIGGTTRQCSEIGYLLYSQVIKDMHVVTSTKSAEMTKLLENTFRSVNIAFINEMALLCDALGMDIWEIIDAAATKPFGFMKFTPGPGIGGHCIPLDPMYLSWKAKESNFYSRFIDLAQETNNKMPEKVIQKVTEVLNIHEKAMNRSNILIMGMAYKSNIDDVRESPALDVYDLLVKNGANTSYYDPYVTTFIDGSGNEVYHDEAALNNLEKYDLVLLLTHHQMFDLDKILEKATLILDTRDAFKTISAEHLYRIGTGVETKKVVLV
ncbi:nucleotide sugar dehydrogenase [Listeria booriae]|uniref:Nucleotide sugar dehydrogenase n=1 Tax=Listeria booriae TaxID=1552123 RepID=A0A841Y209_9LIST|nr:nucleotide sugar dehydrogenase [Listeria booriae]MBC1371323.1 nucleotide sugar dehydrogenase [Listeria booriae]MBC2676735.1 nucleotide sugar dehydrogenase [Listeria booriae]